MTNENYPVASSDYYLKPAHKFQKYEAGNNSEWDTDELNDYTYQNEWHSVYTIQLGELVETGVFDWTSDYLNWSDAAYSNEQYTRFCNYFIERFRFREISIVPALEWFYALKRMLVYELMPKYKPLYEQIQNGISPLGENEYYKRRKIESNYPETLLSGNSDYISTGDDEEYERIKIDDTGDSMRSYTEKFRSVDAAIGDELEVLFTSMYTSYANGF